MYGRVSTRSRRRSRRSRSPVGTENVRSCQRSVCSSSTARAGSPSIRSCRSSRPARTLWNCRENGVRAPVQVTDQGQINLIDPSPCFAPLGHLTGEVIVHVIFTPFCASSLDSGLQRLSSRRDSRATGGCAGLGHARRRSGCHRRSGPAAAWPSSRRGEYGRGRRGSASAGRTPAGCRRRQGREGRQGRGCPGRGRGAGRGVRGCVAAARIRGRRHLAGDLLQPEGRGLRLVAGRPLRHRRRRPGRSRSSWAATSSATTAAGRCAATASRSAWPRAGSWTRRRATSSRSPRSTPTVR
jgi:hypothetical protein